MRWRRISHDARSTLDACHIDIALPGDPLERPADNALARSHDIRLSHLHRQSWIEQRQRTSILDLPRLHRAYLPGASTAMRRERPSRKPPRKCRAMIITTDGDRYLTRWRNYKPLDEIGPDEPTWWQLVQKDEQALVKRKNLKVRTVLTTITQPKEDRL
jgi:hypothetical protein